MKVRQLFFVCFGGVAFSLLVSSEVGLTRANDLQLKTLPHKKLFTAAYLAQPPSIQGERSGGHFRLEFVLPNEKIFQANMSIAQVCHVEINGNKIPQFTKPREANWEMYITRGVDIAGYLQPGRNCIGLSSWRGKANDGRLYPPFVFCQGKVIMASGETISLDTDIKTWQYSRQFQEGWSRPEFDTQNWLSPISGGDSASYKDGKVPAYSGFVDIVNPYEEKLFYSENKNVVFEVRIPKGLKKNALEVSYNIVRVGKGESVSSGKASASKSNDIYARFDINAGRLQRGVYTVSFTLREGARTVEERLREPFVVIGKIPQKEMTAREIAERMDKGDGLELVDVIDCTDPGDPYPYIEGGPGQAEIVKHGNLAYREAGPGGKEKWM